MTAPTKPLGFTEEAFATFLAGRAEPDWMTERRKAAWQTFQSLPMPDPRKDEEWRRTPMYRLNLETTSPLIAAATTSIMPLAKDADIAASIVLADGVVLYGKALGAELRKQGVIVTDLRTALAEHPDLVQKHFMTGILAPDAKFTALHGAFWDNGIVIYVPRNVVVEAPITAIIAAVMPGRASLNHTLIIMERGSQLKYVEELRTSGPNVPSFSCRAIEILLEDNATLDFATIQRFGPAMLDVYTSRAVMGNDTNLLLHTVELGAALSKGHIEAELRGNNANARLFGLYFADHEQHLDRYTLQDHRGVNTTSDLLFKGIVADHARSVYSGYIRVHPGAKKSRAYQQNRNIQLSRKARADPAWRSPKTTSWAAHMARRSAKWMKSNCFT
jgi:Fe-S cluster assembly protein SufD